MMDPSVELSVSAITDWKISLDRPHDAIQFPGPSRVSQELYGFVEDLACAVREADPGEPESGFSVTCHGFQYRAQQADFDRYHLRLKKQRLWKLKDLRFKQEHIDLLMADDLRRRGGLVLVSGPPGSGKTTTAATVIGARLSNYGGYALTLEDPPEDPLAGWHVDDNGKERGYCDQLSVKRGDYQEAIARGLRLFPSKERAMLFVGEIRDPDTAAELLRISVGGYLTFATLHANGIDETVQRLINLAREKVGDAEARNLLANSLRLCVNQRLEHNVAQVSILEIDQTAAAMIRDPNKPLNLSGRAEIRPRPV